MHGDEFENWLKSIKAGDEVDIANPTIHAINKREVTKITATQITTTHGRFSRKDGFKIGDKYTSKYHRNRILHPDDAKQQIEDSARRVKRNELFTKLRYFRWQDLENDELQKFVDLLPKP